MKKSTKAALISGLVFPGLGHLYIRKYIIGILLLATSGWAVYALTSTAIDIALEVVSEIERGNMAIDPATISQMVSKRSEETGQSTSVPTWLLLASWLIGIVDSYRAGRVQDQVEESAAAEKLRV